MARTSQSSDLHGDRNIIFAVYKVFISPFKESCVSKISLVVAKGLKWTVEVKYGDIALTRLGNGFGLKFLFDQQRKPAIFIHVNFPHFYNRVSLIWFSNFQIKLRETSLLSSFIMAQNHAAKKRRREPFNVDTKLVEIYDDLANENDEIRLKAAQALVSQFTPDKNPTDEQIQKALQRLFRGLCSSRKAARIGFSIALTEVLAQVFAAPRDSSELTVSRVLNTWESQSNASGSESGQVGRLIATIVVGC